MLHVAGAEVAQRWVVYPGSTIKPFTLLSLLGAGRIKPRDTYLCDGILTIDGHQLNCTHPRTSLPMDVARTISYSCNCAAAKFAGRFRPGELRDSLTAFGFDSPAELLAGPEANGIIEPTSSAATQTLQALGQAYLRITPAELLAGYVHLARRSGEDLLSPLTEGMEGAVDFGNAQALRMPAIRVAAKTGTARLAPGITGAWVAGFAPSRSPEVAFAVLVQGSSGGADAAPIAASLLRSYFGVRA